jgi:hypothetical protein
MFWGTCASPDAGPEGSRSSRRAETIRAARLVAYMGWCVQPYGRATRAYAYVDTGRKVGNVVVIMPGHGRNAV